MEIPPYPPEDEHRGLTLDEYQERSQARAIYPDAGKGTNIYYPTLGICGEAGEVAEKIKKVLRDKNGVLSEEDLLGVVKELGDVLWYVAALSRELGVNLQRVAELNLAKLTLRHANGTLHGSGDDR